MKIKLFVFIIFLIAFKPIVWAQCFDSLDLLVHQKQALNLDLHACAQGQGRGDVVAELKAKAQNSLNVVVFAARKCVEFCKTTELVHYCKNEVFNTADLQLLVNEYCD